MFATSILSRCAAKTLSYAACTSTRAASTSSSSSTLPPALQPLLSSTLSKTLEASSTSSAKPRKLYALLSRLPYDGVGARVAQARWSAKGIGGCFWEVSRVQLKCGGKSGDAWGWLVWRGKLISEKETRIRGALKYHWKEGHSEGTNLPPVQSISPKSIQEQLADMKKAKDRELARKAGKTQTATVS